MTEKNNYNGLGSLNYVLRFIEKYPALTNFILILEAVALFWAVLTYNFTTNI